MHKCISDNRGLLMTDLHHRGLILLKGLMSIAWYTVSFCTFNRLMDLDGKTVNGFYFHLESN